MARNLLVDGQLLKGEPSVNRNLFCGVDILMKIPEPASKKIAKGVLVLPDKVFERVRGTPRAIMLSTYGTGQDTFCVAQKRCPCADFICKEYGTACVFGVIMENIPYMWSPILDLCHATPSSTIKLFAACRAANPTSNDKPPYSWRTNTLHSLVKFGRCTQHEHAALCKRYCENSGATRRPPTPGPRGGEDSPLYL